MGFCEMRLRLRITTATAVAWNAFLCRVIVDTYFMGHAVGGEFKPSCMWVDQC